MRCTSKNSDPNSEPWLAVRLELANKTCDGWEFLSSLSETVFGKRRDLAGSAVIPPPPPLAFNPPSYSCLPTTKPKFRGLDAVPFLFIAACYANCWPSSCSVSVNHAHSDYLRVKRGCDLKRLLPPPASPTPLTPDPPLWHPKSRSP
jgi:hypothetical protein